MENKENSESRLQTLLIKDWFSEQPGNIITKKVCVINDKTLFYYKHLKKSNAACFYTPILSKLSIIVQMWKQHEEGN